MSAMAQKFWDPEDTSRVPTTWPRRTPPPGVRRPGYCARHILLSTLRVLFTWTPAGGRQGHKVLVPRGCAKRLAERGLTASPLVTSPPSLALCCDAALTLRSSNESRAPLPALRCSHRPGWRMGFILLRSSFPGRAVQITQAPGSASSQCRKGTRPLHRPPQEAQRLGHAPYPAPLLHRRRLSKLSLFPPQLAPHTRTLFFHFLFDNSSPRCMLRVPYEPTATRRNNGARKHTSRMDGQAKLLSSIRVAAPYPPSHQRRARRRRVIRLAREPAGPLFLLPFQRFVPRNNMDGRDAWNPPCR